MLEDNFHKERFLITYGYNDDLINYCTINELRQFIKETEKKPILIDIERPGKQPFPFIGSGYVWKKLSKKEWQS